MSLSEYIKFFKMLKGYFSDPKKLNVLLAIVIIILLCVMLSGIVGGLFYIRGLQQRIESLKDVQAEKESAVNEKRSLEIERFQLTIEKERNYYQSKVDSLGKLINLREEQIKELNQKIVELEQQNQDLNSGEIFRLKKEIIRLRKEKDAYAKEKSLLEDKIKVYKDAFELIDKIMPDTLKNVIQQYKKNNIKDLSIDIQKEVKKTQFSDYKKETIKSAKVQPIEFDSITGITGIKSKLLSNEIEDLPVPIDVESIKNLVEFEVKVFGNDTVVNDIFYGLMWQKGGTLKFMNYIDSQRWIGELNREGYAGFHDWRLPEKEEVITLVRPKNKNKLYIDPVFDKRQGIVWTSTKADSSQLKAWVVNFFNATSCKMKYIKYSYVRAVRIIK